MISEEELDAIRREQEKYLDSQVDTKRRHLLEGEGSEFAWHLRELPCRITPGVGVFREVAGQFAGITPVQLTFRYDTDVKVADQVIGPNSEIFEIRAVRSPKTYHTALQVLGDWIN